MSRKFDQNRRKIRSEYAKKAEDYRNEAKDLPDDDPRKAELEAKAQKIQTNLRLFDSITSALYAPNSNGIIGDVTRAVSPELAYRIGQYFKENKLKNEIDGGNRPEEQSLQHLLAHTILGAAVSYATGNNPITGALSAVGKLTSLVLLTAGVAIGADTSATATAVNVDAFNRQLHDLELTVIDIVAKKYAEQFNIDEEEAKKQLIRGALYNIDTDWKKNIDRYAAEEIESYQQAYNFLINETKDSSLHDCYNNNIATTDATNQDGTKDDLNRPTVMLPTAVITGTGTPFNPYTSKANEYLSQVGRSFTAADDDFNNQRLFLNSAFDTNSYANYANLLNNINTSEAVIALTEAKYQFINGLIQGVQDSV
ncbi:hypothetical protein [Moraxella cuniculi]|uniref:Uncharacterized protein n=1 Tax=Moraxella cuniculi TaxID=34061 RepID=A0A448GWN4_9GAMM|nr:hypothetical protein [Moraxella cuniculi]VEG13177.1 Uncharacterised protein [Moraxella cuniculi]